MGLPVPGRPGLDRAVSRAARYVGNHAIDVVEDEPGAPGPR